MWLPYCISIAFFRIEAVSSRSGMDASIFAMFRHYAKDKAHIYSVDIRHLDVGH